MWNVLQNKIKILCKNTAMRCNAIANAKCKMQNAE